MNGFNSSINGMQLQNFSFNVLLSISLDFFLFCLNSTNIRLKVLKAEFGPLFKTGTDSFLNN